MRSFICIYNKSLNVNYLEIADVYKSMLPFKNSIVKQEAISNHRFYCIAFTNEKYTDPLFIFNEYRAILRLGHFGYKQKEIENNFIKIKKLECITNAAINCSGEFGVVILENFKSKIPLSRFIQSVCRSVPMYWVETEDFILVADRFLGLLEIGKKGFFKIQINHLAFSAFISHGYFPLPLSPVSNIKPISINKYLDINYMGDISIYNINYIESPKSILTDNIYRTDVVEALLDSVVPIINTDIQIGLTGGRDSRLVGAALKKRGVDFEAFTKGDFSHPDVIIGGRLAELWGIKHYIKSSPGRGHEIGKSFTVFPSQRIQQTLIATDGMVSGYEGLLSVDTVLCKEKLIYGGGGGPHISGGLNRYPIPTSEEKVMNYLIHYHRISKILLKVDAWLNLEKYVKTWLQDAKDEFDVSCVLDWFFLYTKSGSWSSNVLRANPAVMKQNPLTDNKLVRLSYQGDPIERASELFYFSILKEIDAKAACLPLFNRRLLFDNKLENNPFKEGWEHRKPLIAKHGTSASFNWRFLHAHELRNYFSEIFFDLGKHSILYDMINWEELNNALNNESNSKPTRLLGRAVWALASLIIFETNFVKKMDFPNPSVVIKAFPMDNL